MVAVVRLSLSAMCRLPHPSRFALRSGQVIVHKCYTYSKRKSKAVALQVTRMPSADTFPG